MALLPAYINRRKLRQMRGAAFGGFFTMSPMLLLIHWWALVPMFLYATYCALAVESLPELGPTKEHLALEEAELDKTLYNDTLTEFLDAGLIKREVGMYMTHSESVKRAKKKIS